MFGIEPEAHLALQHCGELAELAGRELADGRLEHQTPELMRECCGRMPLQGLAPVGMALQGHEDPPHDAHVLPGESAK